MNKFYFTLIFSSICFFVSAQSSEVGITEGQLSVSLSGGANYSIPIAVPPGINGVVPQISLSYNSQAGNGTIGYGWNISGVSTISRIPSTQYHDGEIDPVDFDTLDRFSFDGQRILVKNGTAGVYGANGTIYETESFSNIKITSYGVNQYGVKYGPAYFIVEYPDGSKAQYGSSHDSCSLTDWSITYWENPQGVRISYEYFTSQKTLNIANIHYGALGAASPINLIRFFYKQRDRNEQTYIGGESIVRDVILDKIEVKGNGVGFRNYALTHEITSLGYERLISVTEENGTKSKSYNPTVFSYDTTQNDELFKIQESALLGQGDINSINTGNISGDFDGDGKTDAILYPKTGTDVKKKYTLYKDINTDFISLGMGHDVGEFKEIFPVSFLSSENKIMPHQGWAVLKETDKKYVFTVWSAGTTSSISSQYEKVVNFPLDVVNETCTKNCDIISSSDMAFPKKILSGDFNGDGLTDVVAIDEGTSGNYCGDDGAGHCMTQSQNLISRKVYFVDLKRDNTTEFIYSGNLQAALNLHSKVQVIDFNGDGKSDFLIFDIGFVRVYTLDNANKLVLLFQNTIADAGIALDKPILMGDYNGDGKTDFVIPEAVNEDSWNFYFSTGTTFNKLSTAIGIAYYGYEVGYFGVVGYPFDTYSLNETAFIANDYNGDGKTDILFQQNLTVERIGNNYDRNGEPQLTTIVLLENLFFDGTEIHFNLVNKNSQIANVKRNPIPIFTNHNQINQNLEYSLISNNAIQSFNSPKDTRVDVLVKRITNGNKVEQAITYDILKYRTNEVYSGSPSIESYPNFDVLQTASFQVVSKLEKRSAAGLKKQLFSYYGAVSNVEGLGFLGFRSTVRTNWHDREDAIISSISKNDIALRGANTENYTVLGLHAPLTAPANKIDRFIVKEGNYTVTGSDHLKATQSIILKPNTWIKPGSTFSTKIDEEANNSPNTPTDFITKSRLNYESELLTNKVFKIQNTVTKEFNALENTSAETNVTYDANNNPLKSTTYLKQAGATIQTTVSDVAYIAATPSPYVVGRQSSKKQNVTLSTDVMTSEELYFYQNSLLTQIKKKGTNTDYITEDNAYDSFGNITKKTISAGSLSPRITSYAYDPSGRFLIKSTDIEGLFTTCDYNLNNGLLNSETNPYGLVTSYLYDSWFKKTNTTDYLGKSNSYTYTRSGESTIVTLTASDGSVSVETFDDLGRKIKVGIKNIMGTFSYVDYLYDIQDRNYKTSEPYFGSAGAQWNETKYDVYGRVTQNIDFTGKITDITYSGLTTTVNDGTKSKTSIKNAIGNAVSMTDTPGGTIKYTYFANGNLKESDYAGVKTTISQDGWGRKTKLVDSSAGTYTYAYNAFGETTSETTPNGTTTYTIDDVGKVTQKIINGTNTNSKTTYNYDSSSKLLLSNSFEDLNNAGSTILNSFTFDDKKRITKTVETTPYAVFTKELTYDGFGRINTETSKAEAGGKSSSKTVKSTYKYGSHWQILDNATSAVLWQTTAVNARGQLTSAQNGPTTVTNLYDTYGFVSQFKYDRTLGSVNILTLNTVFDAKKGNLTSRTNSLFNRNDSFKYDEQDRLTEFTNVAGVQEKQYYDDQGRITQNSLGTYSYSNQKPYQNTSITPTPEALTYYTAKPTQNITYNSFKSPVEIEEKNIDKISFLYNDNNSRTAMFYGGLQNEKLERPLRKYYSADGSMEIKENKTTGIFEFITYIGGDGYSAPIVVKSNGTVQDYLYLQRDYQGSIVAITNQAGTIVEKRLFDAWGAIVSVQDGAGNALAGLSILDRGYTGHEHLQSVGLINMNGRIYDPKLHRFLQPDNFVQDPLNTQNYNRYGYCWNNPLVYTDPSGEIIPLIIVGIIVVSAAINVYQNWDDITGDTGKFSNIKWGKLLGYTASGAISGALTVYGGPYGVVWAGGTQAYLNSSIKGLGMGETLLNIGAGATGGLVTRGVGLSFDATFTQGLIGGNNIFNSVITGATREVVSNVSGNLTSNLIGTKFENPSKSFKEALDPVNLGLYAVGGGFSGLNAFLAQPSYVPNTPSPLIYSLELRPMTPFNVNPSLVIPKFNIPTRNVIPPTFYAPKLKPQFKG